MRWLDLKGILGTALQFGINGLQLKNTGGKIRARNANDDADAPLVGSSIQASGDSLVLNEDAAGAGADWSMTISRPDTGMTQNLTFKMPANYGTADFVLKTDGAGNLSWGASASATNLEATDTTDLDFDSTGTTGALYSRDSILGTVSQSGGVPTGAIIERGSNANGEYIRYADGTQICWVSGVVSGADPNIAVGSIFYSNIMEWTFPASFVSGAVVTYIQSSVSTRWVHAVNTNDTTKALYRVFAAVSGSSAGSSVSGIAIGRWF